MGHLHIFLDIWNLGEHVDVFQSPSWGIKARTPTNVTQHDPVKHKHFGLFSKQK